MEWCVSDGWKHLRFFLSPSFLSSLLPQIWQHRCPLHPSSPHPQVSLFTIHWDTIAGWHFSSFRCIWIIHDLPFRWHHGARAPTRYESYSIYTSNVQLFTIYTVNNLSQDAEWRCQVIRVVGGRVWSSRSIWLFTARDISPDKRISGLLNAITVSKTDNKDW